MPRPCKKRKIGRMPSCNHFISNNKKSNTSVSMSLDEYEVIRLIDLEGYTQMQCAESMGVARTTIQFIYESARRKMAQFLVMGAELRIEGGNIMYEKEKERVSMRIAVTYDNGEVFQHFGHTKQFKIYTVMNQKVISEMVVDTQGQGHGLLATFLKEQKVDVLICGGIGQGAKNALAEANIHLFPGVQGNSDEVIAAYLNNALNYNSATTCNHHHEDGHNCKDHDHKHEHHCGGHCHH